MAKKPKSVQSYKLTWNKGEYRAYLKTPEVQKLLQRAVDAITLQANITSGYAGYEGDVRVGKNRARGMVKTVGAEGAEDNATNNTLLKSMDAGR